MSHNATGSEMLPVAETHPTLLAIGIAVTVLDGIHDEPLEYVLRRGYAAMGMAPGLAAKMCQRLADCQTEDAATLNTRAERAEAERMFQIRDKEIAVRALQETLAEIARLRAERKSVHDQIDRILRGDHGSWDASLSRIRAALSSEPQAAADGGRG